MALSAASAAAATAEETSGCICQIMDISQIKQTRMALLILTFSNASQ